MTDCWSFSESIFSSTVLESLNALLDGMPSGYLTGCYSDPDYGGVSVERSDDNKWCTDGTSEQIFHRGEVDPESVTWCYGQFYL